MRKAFVSAAGVLAVLMAVSLTFLIPSGAVTEEAQQRYLDAAYEEEEGWDEATLPKPDAVLASAVFSDILPAATVDEEIVVPDTVTILFSRSTAVTTRPVTPVISAPSAVKKSTIIPSATAVTLSIVMALFDPTDATEQSFPLPSP